MPRTPYCTGCGVLFPKMHLMINHRRQEKCGGRFLPEEERIYIQSVKNIREFMGTEIDQYNKDAYVRMIDPLLEKATRLREERLGR